MKAAKVSQLKSHEEFLGNLQLSTRFSALPPSSTLAVGDEVRRLRAQGRNIHNLSGGSPDPAPPVALDFPSISHDENRLGDPRGELVLREAFAKRLSRVHGVERSGKSEIIATIGAKQAVYFSLLALLESGDEVIVIDPCWVTYAPSIALVGGRAVPVPLSAKNALDIGAIAAAVTSRTRAVLINTPHNPTGRVFTESELSSLAQLVKAKNLWLICDESFDLFTFDGRRHVSPGVFDFIRDQTILLYSFSKSFSLPSARIGMLVGPKPLVRLIANCTQQVITSVALPSQKIAYAALEKENEWTKMLRKAYQDKRDACLAMLETEPRLATHVPEGTFYVFPDIRRLGVSSAELTRHLLDKANVAVTPGVIFGGAGEAHIRINLVGPIQSINIGMKALLRGLPT
jgi:aspartate/methionine/tyrosine aminotransferase